MADRGFNCALSIPTVMRGVDISVDTLKTSVALNNSIRVPEINETMHICIFARLEE